MLRWLRDTLAVVLPVAILAGGVGAIARWQPPVEVRAAKVAGDVVNGVRRGVSAPEWIEARLERARPRVLVLGNSVANTDVDVGVLADRLGVRPAKVQVVSIPGSIGPHWYAVLRNRVYREGHRPDAVVVITPIAALLETIPVTAAMAENLAVQLEGDEPESFRRKIGSWRFGAVHLDRVRANAHRLRTALFRAIRYADPRVELAVASVMGAERLDYTLHDRPAFDAREGGVRVTTALPSVEGSFLPELQELVCGHGGKLIVVRPPLSPLLEPDWADPVPPRRVAEVERSLDPQCAALVDLSRLGVGPADFEDPVHLDVAAARRMTALLGDRMAALRAVQPVPMLWRPAPPPAHRIERTGLVVEEPWQGPPDAFQVQVVLAPREGGSAAHARVLLSGEPFPAGVPEPGGLLRATWTGPQPPAPWTVEIGPEVALRAVAIGKPGARTMLVGRAEDLEGPRIELVGPEADGPVERTGGSLAGVRARFDAGGRLPPSWALPGLAPLLDALVAEGLDPAACSPVEIREAGRPLPLADGCRTVFGGRARSCFDGGRVWFRPLGGAAVDRQVLAPRPGAGCGDALWLQPGERLRFRAEVDGRLPEGARRIAVEALGTAEGIELAVGIDGDTSVRAVGGRRWVHNLARPVEAGAIEVVVENRSRAGWVLLRELAIR